MLLLQGLATKVAIGSQNSWPVPEQWSLEEAATVPVVYTTAYYALVVRGHIRSGQSILIHSGSGGVGQAAISIALSYGCKVFTTVGSNEKRQYLKERFPELEDSSFFNSRDLSFQNGIMRATNGKGMVIEPAYLCLVDSYTSVFYHGLFFFFFFFFFFCLFFFVLFFCLFFFFWGGGVSYYYHVL